MTAYRYGIDIVSMSGPAGVVDPALSQQPR
jgi:hypothetical protein